MMTAPPPASATHARPTPRRPRAATVSRLAVAVRPAQPPRLLRAPVVINTTTEVRTPRLLIRPLVDADHRNYTTLVRESREHLARHFPLHREDDTDETVCDRHLAYSRGAAATGRAWRRVLCLNDGSLAGVVNINDIATDNTDIDRTGEINFWLAPRFVGMGLCSEALRAVIHHALTRSPRGLGLARVVAYVAPDNASCVRLMDRCGFTRDTLAPLVQFNLAERWVTHVAYIRRAPAPTIALQRLVAAPLLNQAS